LLVVGDAIKSDGEGPPPAENPQQIQEHLKRIQETNERIHKWIACMRPFSERVHAVLQFDNQLAVMYPRFGLLWTEWMNQSSHCHSILKDRGDGGAVTDSDAALCDLDELKQAHADFVNRVASTAEPAAVRNFNMGQIAARLAESEGKEECGE
jgi:hypothetical protein